MVVVVVVVDAGGGPDASELGGMGTGGRLAKPLLPDLGPVGRAWQEAAAVGCWSVVSPPAVHAPRPSLQSMENKLFSEWSMR